MSTRPRSKNRANTRTRCSSTVKARALPLRTRHMDAWSVLILAMDGVVVPRCSVEQSCGERN